MTDLRFPKATRAHAESRRAMTPQAEDAFRSFSKAVFAEGALDTARRLRAEVDRRHCRSTHHAMSVVH